MFDETLTVRYTGRMGRTGFGGGVASSSADESPSDVKLDVSDDALLRFLHPGQH